MEDMKRLTEKYRSALESIKEVRKQLSSVIIKYLLLNSYDFKKCTELAISENLGIPRGTVRRALSDLSPPNEPVLECHDLGTIKPYAVVSIGYAIDRGHVSFTRRELQEILSIKESPKPFPLAADTSVRGGRRYLTPGAAKCYSTFVARFYSYLPAAEVNKKIGEAYKPEKIEELELLLPELSAFSKAIGYHAIVQPWSSSDLIFLGRDASPEDIRGEVKKRWEREIRFVLNRLETFANSLEDFGYEGTVEKFGIPEVQIDWIGGPEHPPADRTLEKEYLWATTMALRNGSKIAEKLDVEQDLLDRAIRLSNVLDRAVEDGYEGNEKAGPLEVWAKDQQ